jgi:polyisoprenoid-binding protein YceI
MDNHQRMFSGRFDRTATLLAAGFFCLLLGACAAIVRPNFTAEVVELRAGQYRLDTRHSSVHFKVGHLGLSTYVGRFNSFDASLDFDPQDIGATRIEGTVELGSVDTGDDEVDDLLSQPAWFDTERHPQASFRSTSVEPLENNMIGIEGELTIRGVTRPVYLNGQFNGGADNLLTRRYTIGFSATLGFLRSDFGMDRFNGLVGDEVEIELFAEFLRNR